MKRLAHAKRRDANELEIVLALQAIGCTVLRLDPFDLLVGRGGRSVMIEVKNRDGKNRRTDAQIEIDETWKGSRLYYVHDIEEAIAVVDREAPDRPIDHHGETA